MAPSLVRTLRLRLPGFKHNARSQWSYTAPSDENVEFQLRAFGLPARSVPSLDHARERLIPTIAEHETDDYERGLEVRRTQASGEVERLVNPFDDRWESSFDSIRPGNHLPPSRKSGPRGEPWPVRSGNGVWQRQRKPGEESQYGKLSLLMRVKVLVDVMGRAGMVRS